MVTDIYENEQSRLMQNNFDGKNWIKLKESEK